MSCRWVTTSIPLTRAREGSEQTYTPKVTSRDRKVGSHDHRSSVTSADRVKSARSSPYHDMILCVPPLLQTQLQQHQTRSHARHGWRPEAASRQCGARRSTDRLLESQEGDVSRHLGLHGDQFRRNRHSSCRPTGCGRRDRRQEVPGRGSWPPRGQSRHPVPLEVVLRQGPCRDLLRTHPWRIHIATNDLQFWHHSICCQDTTKGDPSRCAQGPCQALRGTADPRKKPHVSSKGFAGSWAHCCQSVVWAPKQGVHAHSAAWNPDTTVLRRHRKHQCVSPEWLQVGWRHCQLWHRQRGAGRPKGCCHSLTHSWCWVLCQIGHEIDVVAYVSFWRSIGQGQSAEDRTGETVLEWGRMEDGLGDEKRPSLWRVGQRNHGGSGKPAAGFGPWPSSPEDETPAAEDASASESCAAWTIPEHQRYQRIPQPEKVEERSMAATAIQEVRIMGTAWQLAVKGPWRLFPGLGTARGLSRIWGAPDPPKKRRITPPDRGGAESFPWMLLSVFDGLGCARAAAGTLEPKLDPPTIYISWETDPECQKFLADTYAPHQRGDFTQENMEELGQLLDSVDPERRHTVLLTAGPPCVDYSRIRGDEAPGRDGQEGQKFEAFAAWQKEPLKRLVENVLPHRQGDIGHFTDRMDMEAIIFDAAEFKRISRPRVWWSDILWSHPTVQEVLGEHTEWKRHFGAWKAKAAQTPTEVHIPSGHSGPECWNKDKVLPCLTTPAPTSQGRKAPKSAQGKMSTPQYNRWVSDNRCYAPWHYDQENMLVDSNNRYQLLPIETKETLHHLPLGYSLGEKTRHKCVANSWHIGVARLLILLLMIQPKTPKAVEVPKPMAACPSKA